MDRIRPTCISIYTHAPAQFTLIGSQGAFLEPDLVIRR